jgi:hypothetical protein
MAKQTGMIPISGSIDNLTFYKHPEFGDLVKKKGGPTKEMIKKGEQFDITRRNNSEFGRASHYGGIIRTGFATMIKDCKERRLDTNLSTRLRDIMDMDTESEFGNRDLRRNTLPAFRHFELNSYSLSKQFVEFPIEITMVKECLEVTMGLAFKTKFHDVDAWRVRSVALSLDLVNETMKRDVQESNIHELSKGNFALGFTHHTDEQMLTFYGMSVVFYRYDVVTDEYTPRKDKTMNSGFIRYVEV